MNHLRTDRVVPIPVSNDLAVLRGPRDHRCNIHFTVVLSEGVDSLVDVGCGDGGIVRFLDHVPRKLYCDVQPNPLPNDLAPYLQIDAKELGGLFRDRAFGLLTCSDFLEHLTKPDGERFLDEAERVAGRVMVFTTLGEFGVWPEWDVTMRHHPGAHKSGWYPEDFLSRGYQVIVFPQFHYYEAPCFGCRLLGAMAAWRTQDRKAEVTATWMAETLGDAGLLDVTPAELLEAEAEATT